MLSIIIIVIAYLWRYFSCIGVVDSSSSCEAMEHLLCVHLFSLLLVSASSDVLVSNGGHRGSRFHYQIFDLVKDSRMKTQAFPATGKESFLLKTVTLQKRKECSMECTKNAKCLSYNVQKAGSSTSQLLCELLTIKGSSTMITNLESSSQFDFFTTRVGNYCTFS